MGHGNRPSLSTTRQQLMEGAVFVYSIETKQCVASTNHCLGGGLLTITATTVHSMRAGGGAKTTYTSLLRLYR